MVRRALARGAHAAPPTRSSVLGSSVIPGGTAGMLVGILVGLLTGFGCSSGGGGRLQDAAADFAIDYRFGDLPPGCPPAAANDKGVGKSCSKGGHQCSGTQICTCDTTFGVTPPANTPCFCTSWFLNQAGSQGQACDAVPAGACGQSATCCGYMNVAAICVPEACLEASACPVF